MQQTPQDILIRECMNNAIDAFGKEYIFSNRSQNYSKQLNVIKATGVIVPAMLGTVMLSYDSEKYKALFQVFTAVGVLIMVIQFFFSLLSIIYKWDDELSYCFEASQDYNSLSDSFKKLAHLPPIDYLQFKHEFELLKAICTSREHQDTKHHLKDKELRMGMRWALREFQRPCAGCLTIPLSMESTDCHVCGNF